MNNRWNPDHDSDESLVFGDEKDVLALECLTHDARTRGFVAVHSMRSLMGPINPTAELAVGNAWSENLAGTFSAMSIQVHENMQLHVREAALERVVASLQQRVQKLESNQTFVVPVQTFDPEPYDLREAILVVVQPDEEEFGATHFDSNLSATGENPVEAVENLKSIMLDTFEHFMSLDNDGKLGIGPRRQLAVLKRFLVPRAK